jgi:hypothetical protein
MSKKIILNNFKKRKEQLKTLVFEKIQKIIKDIQKDKFQWAKLMKVGSYNLMEEYLKLDERAENIQKVMNDSEKGIFDYGGSAN